MTVMQLAERSHVSPRAVRRQLEALVAAGFVAEHPGERDGLTPGRPASRFAVDPEVRNRMQPLLETLGAPLRPAR